MSAEIDQVTTRPRWFRGLSTLRARIFWSIMPIFIVFVTVSGAINIYLQRRSADEQFSRHGRRMTASLASSIELGVFMEDTEQLIESMAGAASDQSVAYVLIYGEQDRLLASVGRFVGELDSERLQLSVEEMRGLVIDRRVLSRPARSAQQRFSEFVAPVTWVEGLDEEELIGSLAPARNHTPRVIGYVRVGLSRRMLEKDSIALLKVFGVLTATFLMLSLVAIYFLSRRISRPLRQLTAYARQISQGDLDQQIPVTSRDDIGQLAANFNEMTLALKGNIDSKEQLISQVQEFNRTLEERIAERTDELQRRTEALENANRYKSEFLANMSHELRTPLNAIIGYSEMLEEDAVDLGLEESVADLRKIHGAGKHLLALINDILDLSKVEAGQMELLLERFDVKAMVEDVAGTIQPLAGKNHNELQVSCSGDLGEMCADMTRVRQCLFNLLSNACKFTENGKVSLDVCANNRGAVPEVTFCVTDTGIGISERQLTRIFRAFGQADASTTRRFGGTGLGLAISLEYCHLMGGRIDVDSEPGQGSKFTIVLPLDVAAAIEQRDGEQGESEGVEQPEEAEERGQGSGVGGQGGSPESGVRSQESGVGGKGSGGASGGGGGEELVLVIDDDAAARDLLERHLSSAGFRVVTCKSGREGLERAAELRPNVITLDVMMPGMDGWAVLRQLKADAALCDIPVILITMVDDRDLGFALGASDYLTKPLDRGRLVTVLRRHRCEHPPCPVLIVEDDADTRQMLRRMLEKESWRVTEAANGRIALEIIDDNLPALILLDLMMPEMDGFEFLHHLRSDLAWRQIPVIIMTAKDLTEEDRRKLNGRVESVLQKGAQSKAQLLSEVHDLVMMCTRKPMQQQGRSNDHDLVS